VTVKPDIVFMVVDKSTPSFLNNVNVLALLYVNPVTYISEPLIPVRQYDINSQGNGAGSGKQFITCCVKAEKGFGAEINLLISSQGPLQAKYLSKNSDIYIPLT